MISRRDLHGALALLLAISLACTPAHALVSLNDGHDHIHVTGSVGFGWDSNVFASSDSQSDSTMNASIVAEYARRAGWIGVNASVQVDATRYNHIKGEDFSDPKLSAEFTKQTGRTTGSLTLSAARQSRADAAVNMRTTSWNYAAGLNFTYPMGGMYTLSGKMGYASVKYESGTFPELATYSAGADLIRVFSTERDVLVGYNFRRGETSVSSGYDDHALTAGLTGKLIRGINGSLRGGYQVRVPHGLNVSGQQDSKFSSWTASGAATHAINKRMSLTGTLAKDFSTTATDESVDTTTGSLDLTYAYSSHWTLSTSVSGGDSRFLGPTGRHDDYVTASATVAYSMNAHLKVNASYVWFKNWSTSPLADFVRSSYNLNVSSRW